MTNVWQAFQGVPQAEHEPHVSDEAGADRGKVSSTSVGSKANDQVEQLVRAYLSVMLPSCH